MSGFCFYFGHYFVTTFYCAISTANECDESSEEFGIAFVAIIAVVVFFMTTIVITLLAICVFWIYFKQNAHKKPSSFENGHELKT